MKKGDLFKIVIASASGYVLGDFFAYLTAKARNQSKLTGIFTHSPLIRIEKIYEQEITQ